MHVEQAMVWLAQQAILAYQKWVTPASELFERRRV